MVGKNSSYLPVSIGGGSNSAPTGGISCCSCFTCCTCIHLSFLKVVPVITIIVIMHMHTPLLSKGIHHHHCHHCHLLDLNVISVAHWCDQDRPGLTCSRLSDAPLQIWLQVRVIKIEMIVMTIMTTTIMKMMMMITMITCSHLKLTPSANC